MSEAKSGGKQLVGYVVSNKMDKTIVVRVERVKIHPLYGKRIKRHKKFMAHDPENQCNIGDRVLIQESRPLSKNKKWKLVKVLERKLI
jgi:small subunit ribosomal protein S17